MKPRWTESDLREAVQNARSIRQVLGSLKLVQAGGNYSTVKKHIEHFGLPTAHFKGYAWNKGMKVEIKPKRALEEILARGVYYKSFELKQRLFIAGLKPQRCEECGWAQRTPEGHLPLEIHHVNGDPCDNRLENLQIICPNCHSLKPNYRNRIRSRSAMPRW